MLGKSVCYDEERGWGFAQEPRKGRPGDKARKTRTQLREGMVNL